MMSDVRSAPLSVYRDPAGELSSEAVRELFARAKEGILPPDPVPWHVQHLYNESLAHFFVLHHPLPAGFDQWALRDAQGWTVAHIAAQMRRLPNDFDAWTLEREGHPVAATAAYIGHLPPGFDRWDIRQRNGMTVAEIVREMRHTHLIALHEAFMAKQSIEQRHPDSDGLDGEDVQPVIRRLRL